MHAFICGAEKWLNMDLQDLQTSNWFFPNMFSIHMVHFILVYKAAELERINL